MERILSKSDKVISKLLEPEGINQEVAEDGSRIELYRRGGNFLDCNYLRFPSGDLYRAKSNDIVHLYDAGGTLVERTRVKDRPQSAPVLSYEEVEKEYGESLRSWAMQSGRNRTNR